MDRASPVAQRVKNLPANAGDLGDTGLIPESGRSPGEGNGTLLQYSHLGSLMDLRAMEQREGDKARRVSRKRISERREPDRAKPKFCV